MPHQINFSHHEIVLEIFDPFLLRFYLFITLFYKELRPDQFIGAEQIFNGARLQFLQIFIHIGFRRFDEDLKLFSPENCLPWHCAPQEVVQDLKLIFGNLFFIGSNVPFLGDGWNE